MADLDTNHQQDLNEPVGPTETDNWLRCPTFWYLRSNWEPIGPWKPHLALGAAIGVGLNHLLQLDSDLAQNQALDVLRARFEPNDEWTLEALESLTRKAIVEASRTTIPDFLKTEKILGCEVTIGRGRIDLVSKRGDSVIVTDHKTSLQMKSEYVLRNLCEAETDWQLWDYAYRAREYYQTEDIIVRRHLGVLTPRTKWYTHEVRVKPEVLERWVRGASLIWAEINRADILGELNTLPMNLRECHGRYGQCAFYDACHRLNLDSKQMAVLYTEKEKQK